MFSALNGIRVLDFSQFLAGPTCTLILSELGADVTKVERPLSGDPYRDAGPPFLGNESVPFVAVNRNKQSITLDLDHPDSREPVERLLRWADIVVVSFKPKSTAKLGISYEEVRRIRPDIIYCSVSGYGSEGPRADRGALDLIIQAASGLMSVTGPPQEEPVRMGVPITDYGTGMYAALAVVAAVRERDHTGRGSFIDSSLFATAASWNAIPYLHYQVTGENQPRTGNVHPHIAPYQILRTHDGLIAVSAPTQQSWASLCEALGKDELEADVRFATNESRTQNRDALVQALEERFAEKGTSEWLALLDDRGIPCGPVQAPGEVLSDQHWRQHLPLAQHVAHDEQVLVPVLPIRWDGQLTSVRSACPELGQDTEDVLNDLGYRKEEREEMRKRGVV